MSQLKEGVDYYTLDDGRLVFTSNYHLKRGYCCSRGCKHCPYDYENVPAVKRARLLKERQHNEQQQDR
ncbi:MAG: DUF5522 domain-containing protein [Flavipsychrobacter sp.]